MKKKLKDIIRPLEIIDLPANLVDIDINGIAYHSKKVEEGYIFICIKGYKEDGHRYVNEAIQRGARLIVAQREIDTKNVPLIIVKDTRIAMAQIAAEFYDNPTKNLRIIGVTGTNGKTSTCHLIASILKENNERVGVIGTLGYKIDDFEVEMSRTTPESLDLQKIFYEMNNNGIKYVVMEVSSHSLELERVNGINFYGGVFTNLTQDHLDYHGSLENYRSAKSKLFTGDPTFSALNSDDPNSIYMMKSIGKIVTYGVNNKSDYLADNIKLDINGIRYIIKHSKKELEVVLKIPGKFSVYNSLASYALCHSMGIDDHTIIKGLKKSKGVRGRFEVVNPNDDFSIIVDYAHTPDGLENILESIKEFAKGRLISIFGCGGDRDRSKRPIMGKISTTYADITIMTSDNPRGEDPLKIIKDIEVGAKENPNSYHIMPDREEAIKYGIKMAEPGDIVLIAGKGHEAYQEFKDRTVPFDDYKIAKDYLREIGDNK